MSKQTKMMTVDEATDRMALSRATLYRAVSDGELRLTKFGRATRISEADLERYVIVRRLVGEGYDVAEACIIADRQYAKGTASNLPRPL